MINFLLIGDKNYNLQLVNSINSLADNFNLNLSESTIYVIHKNPNSFKRYLKYINYERVEIIKFKKEYKVLNNIKSSHLSEVTYYRLFLDKLLDIKEGFLVYFDADLYHIFTFLCSEWIKSEYTDRCVKKSYCCATHCNRLIETFHNQEIWS